MQFHSRASNKNIFMSGFQVIQFGQGFNVDPSIYRKQDYPLEKPNHRASDNLENSPQGSYKEKKCYWNTKI